MAQAQSEINHNRDETKSSLARRRSSESSVGIRDIETVNPMRRKAIPADLPAVVLS